MAHTALVSGGNRGIGLAVCRALAGRGYRVLLGSRELAHGEREAATLRSAGGDVTAVALDVAHQASVDALAEQCRGVDVLINNAAVCPEGGVVETSPAALEEAVAVNLLGPWRLLRAVLPHMVQRRFGRVVNVSSGWGSFEDGLDGPAAYSVTKAALNALTLVASRGLPANVKVNAVCPGWVRTRMGGAGADRDVDQGAAGVVWLATLPADGPTGGFFRDGERIAW